MLPSDGTDTSLILIIESNVKSRRDVSQIASRNAWYVIHFVSRLRRNE